jgi:hypothetical protein
MSFLRNGIGWEPTAPTNVSRRAVLKILGVGAAAAFIPGAVGVRSALAQASQQVITRAIPRTGEVVPAVGLGTFMTFDVTPGQPREHLREVVRRFWEGGGRVIDTSPLYGLSEVSVGDFATALGIAREWRKGRVPLVMDINTLLQRR